MTLPTEVTRRGRVLDFDIENRPLSYMGSDFTSAEITAIAWSWADTERVVCALLKPPPQHERTAFLMLEAFVKAYDEADIVTGHYIRRHDLPMINGALLEYDMPCLKPKLTCDTKMDLVKKKDLSASQESLADMYGLEAAKHHMSQREWRESNRLTALGLRWTRKRCVDDVIQHKELRLRLEAADALGPPKVWRP